jgi:transcription initiation factor TFIID subunit 5
MTGHSSAITSLSFSAESSVLVSGSLDSTVRCWDVKSAGGDTPSGLGSGTMSTKTAGGENDSARKGILAGPSLGGTGGTLPMGQGEGDKSGAT